MKLLLLTEAEIRQCARLDEQALAAIAEGFSALAAGQVSLPPIMRVDIPDNNGEVDVKSAYIRGLDSFAIKLSSGFFDNYKLGLPSASGMMILISAKTGIPEALLLDNGYLTDVRTGLAGAVAAQYLAPEKVETVGVVGSGAQARYQLRALSLVRDIERVLVYSPNPAHAQHYITEMRGEFGTVEMSELQPLVEQSDVVITTTPAREPYLKAAWLHPGLHITAMGSDSEHKGELEPEVLARADVLVCDSKSQCFRLGELRSGLKSGAISETSDIIELGELTSGQKPGRRFDNDISVCDLTGTGVQDTAIALLAFNQAVALGLGSWLDA